MRWWRIIVNAHILKSSIPVRESISTDNLCRALRWLRVKMPCFWNFRRQTWDFWKGKNNSGLSLCSKGSHLISPSCITSLSPMYKNYFVAGRLFVVFSWVMPLSSYESCYFHLLRTNTGTQVSLIWGPNSFFSCPFWSVLLATTLSTPQILIYKVSRSPCSTCPLSLISQPVFSTCFS